MKEFKTINDILDFAIRAEQEAVEFYTSLSLNSSNPEMVAVFQQFAREEMGHKSRLLRIKEEGVYNARDEKVPDLKIGDYLVDVQPTPNMSYQDALIVAMKKEKAAFKLYSHLAEKAPDATLKNIFLSLAMEESKHKLRFELEYDEQILREN
ncbi:MAG: ferritin family protein [Bacteroidales bacterium]